MIGTYFSMDIFSPYMTLGNNNGVFSVKVKALGFGGQKLIVQSASQYEVIEFEGDLYSDEMVEAEAEFTFTDGYDQHRLAFYLTEVSAFYLDEVTVTQDVKAGDNIYTFVGSKEVGDETSYRFSGLTNSPDFTYAFNVRAQGDYYGEKYQSDYSKNLQVDFNSTAVEEIGNPIDTTVVRAVEGGVEVSLANASLIRVINADGIIVTERNGVAGANFLPVAANGIYIVVTDGQACKVVVK